MLPLLSWFKLLLTMPGLRAGAWFKIVSNGSPNLRNSYDGNNIVFQEKTTHCLCGKIIQFSFSWALYNSANCR
jgi:hypothetical protein